MRSRKDELIFFRTNENALHEVKILFQEGEICSLLNNSSLKVEQEQEPFITYSYRTVYNPFDDKSLFWLSFNNGCLISFSHLEDSENYIVRIGRDSNWVQGLSIHDTHFIFTIDKLSLEDFKNQLDRIINGEQNYALVHKYASGGFDKIIHYGTYHQILELANKYGLTAENTSSTVSPIHAYFIAKAKPGSYYKTVTFNLVPMLFNQAKRYGKDLLENYI